uniref:Immunoglobulin V-set domain-containing protein n=1 Tax=Poecilia formosa TaxID=48698 RepID=A0A096LWH6_POEFO
MKVCFTLICLFFLKLLQDQNVITDTTIKSSAAETHARMGGENITVECKFNLTGNPIIFCKENCEGENILINTTEDKAHKGRYNTLYESNYTSASLHVSISDLKRSDSGRYRCGFGKNRSRYHEFHLDVTEATTSSSSSTTQQTTSSSEPKAKVSVHQLLYVGLSLAILIILLATALLIYCRRKNLHQQK